MAAGQGTRLGAGVPKQYLPLGGVPMLLRAVRPFTTHPEVAHTVVVLPAADAASPPPWLAAVLGGTLTVTAGGAERSDSVAAGLAALPAACTVVLVHDAARPFVEHALITAVAAVARRGEGAVPAIPVGDTLKEVAPDSGGRIVRTVPRAGLYRAQTPQGFPRRVLEQAGVPVRVVAGSARNFKITTEDDLLIAERLL